MIKKRNVFKKNQGNSFIVVVATISFLAVLVAALLVAVALCYRLKAYDINARDNFYYLERAMDEIYAGVGQHSMEHLNQAYDDTLEVLVYYDSSIQAYDTMDDDAANQLLKDTFMYLVKNDARYQSGNVKKTLNGFLSNPYTASNPEGVQLEVANSAYNSATDRVEIKELTLVREAKYSTVNARSGADSAAADTFIQSITTDLMIGKPEFDVSFNQGSSGLNDLYSFALIADMGIEIIGKDGNTAYGNRVDITGDIYAASDFYNKDYNELDDADKEAAAPAGIEKTKLSKVTSYSKDEDRYKACNGVSLKSMYSGLYVDGADLLLMADKLIVPGTIAAMNCATVAVSSYDESSRGFSSIWADSIVLGGYSLRQTVDGSTLRGSNVNMKGRAYISDDLELNANSSVFSMNGEYFGYNYATTDNRRYASSVTEERSFSSSVDKGFVDGKGIEGQAHYNSSAIILNGENTSLDLEAVSSLYVAGQSYIEVSKDKTTEVQKDEDGNVLVDKDGKPLPQTQSVTYQATTVGSDGTVKNQEVTDTYEVDKYDYTSVTKDKDGNIVDNYTDTGSDKTVRQDYRTGEAISIKSNQLAYQLAYIPNAIITDSKDGLYVTLPESLKNLAPKSDDLVGPYSEDLWGDISKIPIIKSVVSGNTYYFFDFSKAKKTNAMNEFIAAYSELFASDPVSGQSVGGINNLMDITNYAHFKVKMLNLYNTDEDGEALDADPYAKIYTNSAITVAKGKTFNIKARSASIKPLLAAASNINAARGGSIANAESKSSSDLASDVTIQLQSQYKEMKWLLSNQSVDSDAVQEAHDLKESMLTPLNYFINMSDIEDGKKILGYTVAQSGSGEGANATNDVGVWISNGDITIGADGFSIDGGKTKKEYDDTSYYSGRDAVLEGKKFDNGIVQGLVIAKGDVTFEDNVNQFNGMIISGGKIIINNFGTVIGSDGKPLTKNSMKISADRHMVERILSALDLRRGDEERCGEICDLFRLFVSQYKPPASAEETATESMKSIAAVEFEDILSFENWMKNVRDVAQPAEP